MGLYVGDTKYKVMVGNQKADFIVHLPYDSRVEYLESNGNQYIDTNYIPTGTDIVIEGKFYLSGYTGAYGYWFGTYTDEQTVCYRIIRRNTTDNAIYITCGGRAGNSNNSYIAGLNTLYEFSLSSTRLVINGTTISVITSNGSANTKKMTLWASNTHSSRSKGKFYYFKVYKNGELVVDFIPVRVGQVGYMYDRVSGQLFGNSGTGNFILGNDIN